MPNGSSAPAWRHTPDSESPAGSSRATYDAARPRSSSRSVSAANVTLSIASPTAPWSGLSSVARIPRAESALTWTTRRRPASVPFHMPSGVRSTARAGAAGASASSAASAQRHAAMTCLGYPRTIPVSSRGPRVTSAAPASVSATRAPRRTTAPSCAA